MKKPAQNRSMQLTNHRNAKTVQLTFYSPFTLKRGNRVNVNEPRGSTSRFYDHPVSGENIRLRCSQQIRQFVNRAHSAVAAQKQSEALPNILQIGRSVHCNSTNLR